MQRMQKEDKHSVSIEFRHLRCFLAATEHGSFRKAGSALGLSQSAISRCVAELENKIGASLFHRHTWGVSQTYAGQRFLSRARRAIRTISEGVDEAASAGRSELRRVRIGIYSSIASGFLADLLGIYGIHHPEIQIEMIDGNPIEHISAIRQLSLDVAFITGTRNWPDCDQRHLWSERVFAVLPIHHALAKNKKLRWRDLAEETFIVSETAPGQEIHDHLVRRIADFGRHPVIQVQHVSRDNLMPLVALDRGLTLVSEAMTVAQFPGVVYLQILGELLPFSAVWSAKNDNPALRRLLSLAKTMADRSVRS